MMNIDKLIDNILTSYDSYGGVNRSEAENFPNRKNVVEVLHNIQSLIFPGFRDLQEINPKNIKFITGSRVNTIIALLTQEIQKALMYTAGDKKCGSEFITDSHCFKLSQSTSIALIEEIPEIRRKIQLDADAFLNGDPAANTIEEIILSYPGLEAILVYRIAHFLFNCGVPVIPRIMSEHIHGKTGIDIHPGAKIGESFFIDHGTGIVIGETCIIGNSVTLYQGVTLGALSVKKELQNIKRHPTIEDNVTIYANATILGGETIIGHDSTIGGNTWLTHSVRPNSIIQNN